MKPAWDALMADYKDHPTKLVADVDCTAAGKPLCDANGPAPSGKRRPYRGLSTPALVADLERTLGTRLRPRHATVQKARRGNGDGYEGWLRRHFASPPRRRSKTSPPKVWI